MNIISVIYCVIAFSLRIIIVRTIIMAENVPPAPLITTLASPGAYFIF